MCYKSFFRAFLFDLTYKTIKIELASFSKWNGKGYNASSKLYCKREKVCVWAPSPYLIFQDLLRVNAIVKGEMVWVMFPCQNFLASPHQLYFSGPSVKNESQSVDNFTPWALLGRWIFLYFLRFASSDRQLHRCT